MYIKKISKTDCDFVIKPDFIYNRFDLQKGTLFDGAYLATFSKEEDCNQASIEFCIKNYEAQLGLWMMSLTKDQFKILSKSIFNQFPKVKKITYRNCLSPLGAYNQGNHFSIELPKSEKIFRGRMTSKSRYNLRREKEKINKDFGAYKVVDYPAQDCPKDIFDKYFSYKKQTHNREYHMTSSEYIDYYHVSDVYVMYLCEERDVCAILLSCEQCPAVFVENLTYKKDLSAYSLGKIIYDEYLCKLIDKNKHQVYLGGGGYEYKRKYLSCENIVFSGVIYRNIFLQYLVRFKKFAKVILKRFCKKQIS